MPVDFLGIATTSNASETQVPTTAPFDLRYLERIVRAHEDNGWTRVLFAYGSSGPEPSVLAAHAAARLDSIELLLAHRPNVSYPTFAAKSFATLDQLSGGRLSVHFITGGNDHEQQREGDTLTKDQRYARTQEYIQIVKRAWTSAEPFDHDGEFYQFRDFVLDAKAVDGRSPTISFGGSSDAAYRVGAAEADIYAVWGEPLDRTAEQIARIRREAAAAGRTTPPRIHAAFRPIIAPTEELAWEKAHRILGAIEARKAAAGGVLSRRHPIDKPENAGSQRLLEIAAQGDRFDSVALDGDREGDRRRRQLERAGRHARAGRGGAAGVLRPGRERDLRPRVRPARRRDRLRPLRHPAGPRGRRRPRRRARRGLRGTSMRFQVLDIVFNPPHPVTGEAVPPADRLAPGRRDGRARRAARHRRVRGGGAARRRGALVVAHRAARRARREHLPHPAQHRA